MSRTQKGIIYPDNYSDVADIPAAMKDMAESIDDIIVNDKNYVHIQNAASNRWVIVHNMNKYPSVTIVNSAGDEVIGDVFYDNTNQVTITFAGAFKGKAVLN